MNNTDWWRGAVIYEIYPRSFMDSSGDGVGDLRGIISKLDYVAALGVDAIWVAPFFKSPMKDFGYDIADYRDVDPVFGTIDDFQALLKEAHARDLKVIIDQVWSHTSDQHDWFKESRQSKDNTKANYYVWADCKEDGTPPNNWLSIFGGPAWTWDTRREQYYLHHFLSCQPALNLWDEEVRQAILDIERYWLDMGVDGFRLDVINCAFSHPELLDNPVRPADMPLPPDLHASNPMARQHRCHAYSYLSEQTYTWLNQLRSVANEFEGTFLLGEIGGDDGAEIVSEYIKIDKRLHSAYSFSLTGKTLTKDLVIHALQDIEFQIEDGWMTHALGNHDNQRFASNHGQQEAVDYDYACLGLALLFSLRGSVCLYQGEELGLPTAEISFEDMQDPYDIAMHPDSMNRDGSRTPMPWIHDAHHVGFSAAQKTWLPVCENHLPLAVDLQEREENSVLNVCRRFLKWRKENDIVRYGAIELIEAPDDIIGYKRIYEDKTVLCLFNCANKKADCSLPEGEVYTLIPEISHNSETSGQTVTFNPYGYAFFDTVKT